MIISLSLFLSLFSKKKNTPLSNCISFLKNIPYSSTEVGVFFLLGIYEFGGAIGD
jgi:hypothetical protein